MNEDGRSPCGFPAALLQPSSANNDGESSVEGSLAVLQRKSYIRYKRVHFIGLNVCVCVCAVSEDRCGTCKYEWKLSNPIWANKRILTKVACNLYPLLPQTFLLPTRMCTDLLLWFWCSVLNASIDNCLFDFSLWKKKTSFQKEHAKSLKIEGWIWPKMPAANG